ncbi:MAG: hypothetical protein AB7H96_23110 [Vicinamibacterales bacterium]
MSVQPDSAARWFSRVVWLGIAANLALAVPTLLQPARMLAVANLPVTEPVLWTRFSGLLLILLSAFYVPAALDPRRHGLVATLAVAARLAGVVFFVLFQPREYHMFGYFDLAFFVPEAALLAAMGSQASSGLAPAPGNR